MKSVTGYRFQPAGLSRVCNGDLACHRRPKTNPMLQDLVSARSQGYTGICTQFALDFCTVVTVSAVRVKIVTMVDSYARLCTKNG